MKNLRVVLGVDSPIQAELIREALTECEGIEVVGDSTDPVEMMALIAQSNADAWIHSLPPGQELQAILSHVHEIRPEIAVVRVCLDEPSGYVELPVRSFSRLAEVLRVTARDGACQSSA